MRNTIGLIFLALLVLSSTALFATNTMAEESQTRAEDIWTRDKLTGDWGGTRSDLSDHGVDIGLRLTQYYQSVANGGVDENDEYGGTMDYRLKIDTHKLFGTWEGFSIDMHARTRYGQDVLADADCVVHVSSSDGSRVIRKPSGHSASGGEVDGASAV